MPANQIVTLDLLDQAIERFLVGRPLRGGRRLLGIEVEHLLLHRRTRENAPLAFCRDLFATLATDLGAERIEEGGVLAKMAAEEFGLSMEPGGQLEVDSLPYPGLADLDRVFARAMEAIDRRLEGTDYEQVAIGHAPRTPVARLGLLPRPRYLVMDREMTPRGPLTPNMMRATAGFQLAYDFENVEEGARKLALLMRLSPVLAAISANSREVEGRDSGFASFRHYVWWHTDRTRVGVPEGCLDVETAIEGYVRFARSAIRLFHAGPHGPEPIPGPPRSLEQAVADRPITQADLELHMSSLFPFVRLRNYLEVRCCDALPWREARSVLAMVSGLVYCPRATTAAEELSEVLAIRDPEALRAFHIDVARHGLDAKVPGAAGAVRDLARELVAIAEATLGGADCDWARAEDLAAVRERIG